MPLESNRAWEDGAILLRYRIQNGVAAAAPGLSCQTVRPSLDLAGSSRCRLKAAVEPPLGPTGDILLVCAAMTSSTAGSGAKRSFGEIMTSDNQSIRSGEVHPN